MYRQLGGCSTLTEVGTQSREHDRIMPPKGFPDDALRCVLELGHLPKVGLGLVLACPSWTFWCTTSVRRSASKVLNMPRDNAPPGRLPGQCASMHPKSINIGVNAPWSPLEYNSRVLNPGAVFR